MCRMSNMLLSRSGVFNRGSAAPWWSATASQGVRGHDEPMFISSPLIFEFFINSLFQHISRLLVKISSHRQNICAGGGGVVAEVTNTHARAGTSVGRELLSGQNGGPWDKTS